MPLKASRSWARIQGNQSRKEQQQPVMDMDQEICLCFHVTRRKIDRFLRLERPKRAAQLSECFSAGTGCGWCRPYLIAMFDAANLDAFTAEDRAEDGTEDRRTTDKAVIPTAESYAEMRQQYRQAKKPLKPDGMPETEAGD